MSLNTAIAGLNEALERLEGALDKDANPAKAEATEEVQRLNLDRAELARKLDQSEDGARRVREANREVSRRLIAAMEAVRTVVERG